MVVRDGLQALCLPYTIQAYIYRYNLLKQNFAQVYRSISSGGNRHTIPDTASTTNVMTSVIISTHFTRMLLMADRSAEITLYSSVYCHLFETVGVICHFVPEDVIHIIWLLLILCINNIYNIYK